MKITSVFRPDLLANKVALVTGGGTGIGKAIACELMYLGCRVMIASRKIEKLEETAKEMRKWSAENGKDNNVEYMTCNIRKDDSVKEVVAATVEKFGRLDFLVNNGGGQFISKAEDIAMKGWNAVIETNLSGTFRMSKEVYNQWMKDNGGSIVNITMDTLKGYPMMSHSGAARAAVDNLTKTLALEWVGSGVRVNSVVPGSSIYSESAAANYVSETAAAKFGKVDFFDIARHNIPVFRNGSVEEVSTAVCFLMSPSASFISGINLPVDGVQSLYKHPNFVIKEHQKIPAYKWETDLEEQDKLRSTKSKL